MYGKRRPAQPRAVVETREGGRAIQVPRQLMSGNESEVSTGSVGRVWARWRRTAHGIVTVLLSRLASRGRVKIIPPQCPINIPVRNRDAGLCFHSERGNARICRLANFLRRAVGVGCHVTVTVRGSVRAGVPDGRNERPN